MSLDLELRVGSLLVYPSRGSSEASLAAKKFTRYDLKQDTQNTISKTVRRLKDIVSSGVLQGYFDEDALLVPMPGHAPRKKDWLWPAQRICEEMQSLGIAEYAELLEREKRVIRSSQTRSGAERPPPQLHLDSFSYIPQLIKPRVIILVDDVVTRGSTLAGGALKLQAEFPEALIKGFAIARVDGDIDLRDTKEMLDPKIEVIHYDATDARRTDA